MAISSSPTKGLKATNYNMNVVVDGGTEMWLGGAVQQMGTQISAWVPINKTTGVVATSGYPDVGVLGVSAAVSDGSGGWFIIGSFVFVDGVKGSDFTGNLVHINSDGTIDESFAPVFDATINCITSLSGILYVGGWFGEVDGQTRSRLCAFDMSTKLLTSWAPNADGTVNTMETDGTKIFVGGNFSNINSTARAFLAAINTNGTLHAFVANCDNSVTSLKYANSLLYVGGNFTTIGASSRNHLAAVDPSTGTATSWNPNVNSAVVAIEASSTHIYIGGYFTLVGGLSRTLIAQIDVGTGVATSFSQTFSGTGGIQTLALDGNVLYAGGNVFKTVGPDTWNGVFSYDITTGSLRSWNPLFFEGMQGLSLVLDGTNVRVGIDGNVSYLTGVPFDQHAIVKVNKTTGLVDETWTTGVFGYSATSAVVYDIALTNDTIYICGNFSSIGGTGRNNIAALNRTTGALLSWYPTDGLDDIGYSIVVNNGYVYVGGQFSTVGGEARAKFAKIDASTGVVASWEPTNIFGTVNSLLIDGTTLYVATGNVSAFDLTTETRISFSDPSYGLSTFGTIHDMKVADGKLFLCGDFDEIDEDGLGNFVTRNFIAACDKTTGILDSWDAGLTAVSGTLGRCLAINNGVVYMGTEVDSTDLTNPHVGGWNVSDASLLLNYNMNIGSSFVFTNGIVSNSTGLWIVGEFLGSNNYEASNYALHEGTLVGTLSTNSTTTAVSATPNPANEGQTVTITGTVTSAGNPTGLVTFYDGVTSLGSASLSGTTASITTAILSVGSHSITAVYAGDAENDTSTSPGVSLSVVAVGGGNGNGVVVKKIHHLKNKKSNVPTPDGPVIVGSPIPVLITIEPLVPDSPIPTGTVEVTIAEESPVTYTLDGDGNVAITVPAIVIIEPGAYPIQVEYSGDENYAAISAGSTSQPDYVLTVQFPFPPLGSTNNCACDLYHGAKCVGMRFLNAGCIKPTAQCSRIGGAYLAVVTCCQQVFYKRMSPVRKDWKEFKRVSE